MAIGIYCQLNELCLRGLRSFAPRVPRAVRMFCGCQHCRLTKGYELQTAKPEDIRVIE